MTPNIEDVFFPYSSLIKTFGPELFRKWVRTGQVMFVEDFHAVAVARGTQASQWIKESKIAGRHYSVMGTQGSASFL